MVVHVLLIGDLHMTTTEFPARMSRAEAAQYLGLSTSSLSADVVTRRLQIPRIQAGRRCIYDRVQLDAWMQARVVNAPAETVNA